LIKKYLTLLVGYKVFSYFYQIISENYFNSEGFTWFFIDHFLFIMPQK